MFTSNKPLIGLLAIFVITAIGAIAFDQYDNYKRDQAYQELCDTRGC